MIAIEQQGQVVRVVNLTPQFKPARSPAKRGDVNGFSRKSRRRLIDLFNRMDWSMKRCTFITLTFSSIPQPEAAKAAFKRFLSRLRYHYPDVSGVWRVELQARGAAHYHLLLFGLPFVKQSVLQDTWTECTGEQRSIVDIRLVKNARHAMSYVSKYVAKLPEFPSLENAPYQQNEPNPQPKWSGRWWGWINEKELPFAVRRVGVLVDEDVANYFWWAARARLRRRDGSLPTVSRMYRSDAFEVYQHALSLGGFDISTIQKPYFEKKQMSNPSRTKMASFFAGINTHH